MVSTISVGTSPAGVAYDSANGEAYVTTYNSNTTSIIDYVIEYNITNVNTILVGNGPAAVVYNSNNDEMYVLTRILTRSL